MAKKKKVKDKEMNENSDKTGDKQKLKNQNKQLIVLIVIMLGVIILTLGIYFYTQNFVNKFSYINLDFQKTKSGQTMFYSARIPIADQYNNIIGNFPINLRNDPRELEKIDTNIINGNVTFYKANTVYVSADSNIEKCEDGTMALATMSIFLKDFANLRLKAATFDTDYSREQNAIFVNCSTNPQNTVIIIKEGDKTSVMKTAENCYELTYNKCEIMPASEKFIVTILDGYMGYFEKE